MRALLGHFEVPVRDPARAAAFFRRVFGWSIEPVAWVRGSYFKVRAGAPGSGSGGSDPLPGGLVEAAPASRCRCR